MGHIVHVTTARRSTVRPNDRHYDWRTAAGGEGGVDLLGHVPTALVAVVDGPDKRCVDTEFVTSRLTLNLLRFSRNRTQSKENPRTESS